MSTPTQVGISRGVGQYGGRRCLKVKGCFFVLQKLLLVRYCLPRYPLLNLLIFSPQSGASYWMLREEKNHLFNRTSICTINVFMPSCPSEKKKQTKKKHIVPSCFKQMRSFITTPKFRQTLHKSCLELW